MSLLNNSTVIRLKFFLRKLRGKIQENQYIYYPNIDLKNGSSKEIFEEINGKNTWGSKESVSGKGSEIKHTRILLRKLNILNQELRIKSMLDAPCGDFNWMKNLDREGIKYTGMDIVEDVINKLSDEYADESVLIFKKGNIIEDQLPKVDLIFCRDCLVHFSFSDIDKTLRNFKNSGSKYLLTTTYGARKINRDIATGGWRPINLEITPFNLGTPLKVIKENNTDDNGLYFDKSMALWELSKLNLD
ncbi:class I SAM-dependent methyltransferase [Echinicola marina]|uniref:class I SAM-dependent methyltransferase n=1 Tax=Echinicola marina TaxID=2859768 RepID=UPI001CF63695|nr:class I SAM-dependent methyltransferase [Echinicola marina]UCS91983.1 class I SAM-dependent methyltransferase [Echinicola marina]